MSLGERSPETVSLGMRGPSVVLCLTAIVVVGHATTGLTPGVSARISLSPTPVADISMVGERSLIRDAGAIQGQETEAYVKLVTELMSPAAPPRSAAEIRKTEVPGRRLEAEGR